MIFLTAGHHNRDSGAVGNGYKESDLTKEIRDLTLTRIKQLSPRTKVWADNDNDTLSQVIAKVKGLATAKDIWVELHFDASSNSTATGATALVATNAREKSKELANDLVSIGSKVLGIRNRGVKTELESNRGRLAMLHTPASSVLYEVAFISNKDDIKAYQEMKYWLSDELARVLIKHDGENGQNNDD